MLGGFFLKLNSHLIIYKKMILKLLTFLLSFLLQVLKKRDEEAGYAMGTNGYIRKPFDAEELFIAVEKCLNV